MINDLDINKIAEITANVIRSQGIELEELHNEPLSRNDPSNTWNILCRIIFGKQDFIKSLSLKTWFLRNTHKYKSLIKMFLNRGEGKESKYSSTKHIEIDYYDWIKLLKYKKESRRSYLTSVFDCYLTQEIKKIDFNCNLKCIYNWFKLENSRKKIQLIGQENTNVP